MIKMAHNVQKEKEKNLMYIRKRENGVTLIALAVTIIVMLILAGATIAMLTGENGIISQATKSRDRSDIAKVEEIGKLEYSNLIIEKQMDSVGEEVTIEDVKERMEEKEYETAEKDGKNYIKIGSYYYEMKVEEKEFSIVKEKTEGITGGIAGKKYEKDTKVIIGGKSISVPGGATISKIPGEYENVDDGIVIYIINDDKANWEDKEYMQKTYDQFVWVPVKDVVLDLSSEYESLTETQIKEKVQEQINAGKYPMTIKTDATNYIGVLYDLNEVTENEEIYVKVTPLSNWTPKSTNGYNREPLITSDRDKEASNLAQINEILNITYSDLGKEMQNQFNMMVKNVQVF